jgi:hypothetical protein
VHPAGDSSASAALYLHVGLENGVLLRTEVDNVTGRLSEQRMRFLGTSKPTLLPVRASGMSAMMALSSSPWLGHVYHGKFQLVPLAYDPVDYVAPFCSEKVRSSSPQCYILLLWCRMQAPHLHATHRYASAVVSHICCACLAQQQGIPLCCR